MTIDQILTTLGNARTLLSWPCGEWESHPERMPACAPGFGAAAHGQRQVDDCGATPLACWSDANNPACCVAFLGARLQSRE
jgi:hypothetical protein